jgi:acetyl esterase/lipase
VGCAIARPVTTSTRSAKSTAIVCYVHGGALFRGDKRNVGAKPDFFCGRGWVLVSINYRLSPSVKVSGR